MTNFVKGLLTQVVRMAMPNEFAFMKSTQQKEVTVHCEAWYAKDIQLQRSSDVKICSALKEAMSHWASKIFFFSHRICRVQ